MDAESTSTDVGIRDVRMRGFRDRAEVEEVLALLRSRLQPLPAEEVELHDAAGRVLANEIVAPCDVPGFDRAAMDGYALRGRETFGAGAYSPLELNIVGISLPAKPCAVPVKAGEAVRIMTGAPLPAGTDAVLPAEFAEEKDGRLQITEPVPPGRHVGQKGEDIKAGTVVFQAGRILRPQDVGVLASLGVCPVGVIRRPTVSIIVTGDELLPCWAKPEPFRIVDSNSVMLEALVRRDVGLPQTQPIVPDHRERIREAMLAAESDVLLISGGSSVGQEDHAPRILAEIGELCIHGVALRPASPAGVGFVTQKGRSMPVFLMPGNPVSCLCAYDLFAGLAVRRLGGRSMDLPYRSMNLPLATKLVSAVGRVDYVRVKISDGRVEPLATTGASILSSTTRADGFVLVPRDSEGHAPGETVRVYFYDAQ
ncbi:MAG TPA: gephyrin-like molybdotransferase Glp [Gemmataceae bacterium]|jgi:molybdopterin molybdotransferase|nr:gephyrin-like molybdotransferase Glp [Gemmataceae bacterium]